MSMSSVAVAIDPEPSGAAPIVRGRVASAPGPERVEVRLAGGGERVRATNALPGYPAPRAGDVVLVATVEGERYVVGVVPSAPTVAAVAEAPPPPVASRVTDRDGRLLFEHDAASGRSVLHAPSGDLELRADAGAIALVADRTRVELRPGALRIDTPELEARAGRASAIVDEASLVARSWSLAAETASTVVELLETKADRIVERARTSCRDVEELALTRTGRLRALVRTSYALVAGRASMRARDDLKLDADKIHLG